MIVKIDRSFEKFAFKKSESFSEIADKSLKNKL